MASDKSRRPQRDLEDRLALLEALGGLVPELIQVSNQEWLYMLLEEETRHSLAIEGVFTSEAELREVLQGRRSAPGVLNHFRTAQVCYDLAYQYRREKVFHLDLPTIHGIHSTLFGGVGGSLERFRGAGGGWDP